jgi:large subunit ribosomal protein L11
MLLFDCMLQVYEDKSYDWILKGPPSSWYIKQASGLARGADRPGHETVATISLKHLYEIAMVSPGWEVAGMGHSRGSG